MCPGTDEETHPEGVDIRQMETLGVECPRLVVEDLRLMGGGGDTITAGGGEAWRRKPWPSRDPTTCPYCWGA